jgi:peptidoglycan glycosyltransferase
MDLALKRLTLAFAAGLVAIVLASGYWGYARGEALLARADNPRRVLLERRVPRGTIYDRNGAVLAEAVGPRGDLARRYPYPSLAPVLGYVSALYGQAGVEAALDPTLHGDDGLDPADVYWRSNVLGTPPEGRDVRLSIDLPVQMAADAALGERAGAVVALDAMTGEILALASHPTYDANHLEDQWEGLVADPRAPLLNRATLGLYQPGGALWPLVIGAAAEAGLGGLDEPFPDPTRDVPVNGQALGCRIAPRLAAITLRESLVFGCPGPIADLGAALGAEALRSGLASLGLYAAPGLDLPTTAVEEQALAGDAIAQAAIGQGALTITPLHLALALAAIAREGIMPAPQLVLATELPNGIWRPGVPSGEARQALSPEAAAYVKALLPDGLRATALTGAAGETLAWYGAFTPHQDSRYVVVVLLENASVDDAAAVGQAVEQAL